MCGKSIDDVRKSLHKKDEPVIYPGVTVEPSKKEVKVHGTTLEEIHAFVDKL